MEKNTKLLVFFTFLIVILGSGLLWYGLKFNPPSPSSPSSQTIVQTTPEASQSAVAGLEGERARVSKVIDGDTFELDDGRKVRLVGIDTPETVDPRRPVGCFGKEASNETKKLLTGKEVILQKDISNTDKYNRLLRFVYLPLENGEYLFVNDYLVRDGFAKAYTYPPDIKFSKQFLEAEQEARISNRGLWNSCK